MSGHQFTIAFLVALAASSECATLSAAPELLNQYPAGAFDDRVPPKNPQDTRFNEYAQYLTRFDDWVTGHGHVRNPQEILPDDEFHDRKPQTDPNNAAFNDYVKELTRFDSWVTGTKVPIPADPATDALHQDLPIAVAGNPQQQQQLVEFNDPAPSGSEAIPAYNDYVKVLTRYDSWVTGSKVPIPSDPTTDALHQIQKRDSPVAEELISREKEFGQRFNDHEPSSTVPNPSYNDFIKELKRYDSYIVGRPVTIPHQTEIH